MLQIFVVCIILVEKKRVRKEKSWDWRFWVLDCCNLKVEKLKKMIQYFVNSRKLIKVRYIKYKIVHVLADFQTSFNPEKFVEKREFRIDHSKSNMIARY